MIDLKSATIVSSNPANKQRLGEIAVTRADDIALTVAKARGAFEKWRQVPLAERLCLVENFRQLLMKRKDSLATQISREAGKPFGEALIAEVFSVLEICTWLKYKAPRILRKKRVDLNPIFFLGKRAYNVYEPLGVVAVISPWNYPFCIPAASTLFALAAGNAVVIKPSPKTALVADSLLRLLLEAGFPPDLIGIVHGDKSESEQLIVSGVDRVIFTGSVAGGKAIMEIASRKLVPVTLELGGKHPAIVLDDADADKIAGGLVWSAYTNAGQACASVDRIYAHKRVADRLLNKMVELTSRLRLGDPLHPCSDIGPVIDEGAMIRCNDLVEDAVSKGAKVAVGGRPRTDLGGWFFEPTILTGINDTMLISKQEIFGPIMTLETFDGLDEVIARANSSDMALTASVWSADVRRAEGLVGRLNAGVVFINDGLYSHACPDAPWGGIKSSGFGKTHSEMELLDFVNVKHVGVSNPGPREWHYPYSQHALAYLLNGLDLVHGQGAKVKVRALTKLAWTKLGQK